MEFMLEQSKEQKDSLSKELEESLAYYRKHISIGINHV
jgi:hypothetical protein